MSHVPNNAGQHRKRSAPSNLAPTENDVLFGRGVNVNRHEGNIFFRRLVQDEKAEYSTSRKHEKDRLARKIAYTVSASGGRFLTKSVSSSASGQSNWEVANGKTVLLKIKQALRDYGRNPTNIGIGCVGLPFLQRYMGEGGNTSVNQFHNSLPANFDCTTEYINTSSTPRMLSRLAMEPEQHLLTTFPVQDTQGAQSSATLESHRAIHNNPILPSQKSTNPFSPPQHLSANNSTTFGEANTNSNLWASFMGSRIREETDAEQGQCSLSASRTPDTHVNLSSVVLGSHSTLARNPAMLSQRTACRLALRQNPTSDNSYDVYGANEHSNIHSSLKASDIREATETDLETLPSYQDRNGARASASLGTRSVLAYHHRTADPSDPTQHLRNANGTTESILEAQMRHLSKSLAVQRDEDERQSEQFNDLLARQRSIRASQQSHHRDGDRAAAIVAAAIQSQQVAQVQQRHQSHLWQGIIQSQVGQSIFLGAPLGSSELEWQLLQQTRDHDSFFSSGTSGVAPNLAVAPESFVDQLSERQNCHSSRFGSRISSSTRTPSFSNLDNVVDARRTQLDILDSSMQNHETLESSSAAASNTLSFVTSNDRYAAWLAEQESRVRRSQN